MDRVSKFHPAVEDVETIPEIDPDLRSAFDQFSGRLLRTIRGGERLAEEGAHRASLFLLLEGWARRYKTLKDGRLQITSLLIPGDVINTESLYSQRSDHSVSAISAGKVIEIAGKDLEPLMKRRPDLLNALLRQQLAQGSIEREWVVNVGQRKATERLAHLLCELFYRLEAVGLTRGRECDFPLTQECLAQATGMTTVHINRVIQRLRARGLIILDRKQLTVLDLRALRTLALFDEGYLHRAPARLPQKLGNSAREVASPVATPAVATIA